MNGGKRFALMGLALWLAVLLGGCGAGLPIIGDDGDNIGNIGEKTLDSPADVYVELAVEYLRRQRYAQALQNAREALARDANHADAHNVIALIYDNLGELNDAERHFRRALSLQPKNPYYRNAFGFHLCKRQRYSDAEQEFLAALRNPLYSSPAVAWNNAGVCALRGGKSAQAEEYLSKALKLEPRMATALIEMAEIAYNGGKTALASDYLRRYHQVSSQTPRSLWLGIRIARKLGDKNMVASYELKLRTAFPHSDEYRLLQGSE